MERSSKHSAMLDDQMKSETESLVRSGHESRVEEWREAEPSGDDQPVSDVLLSGDIRGRSDDGPAMSHDAIEARADIARFLSKEVWPANRQTLEDLATENHAPSHVLEQLRRLPDGRTFENVQDVWVTLGGEVEEGRA